MKIYVVCDLEGVAGVIDHRQQCSWDVDRAIYAPYLAQARRLATLELNALVEAALEAGVVEVVAWDGHGNFPGGIDYELLHAGCKLIMGAGDGGPPLLDTGFDALFQLGLHAMAGTPRAVMAHSFDGSITGYWVNGAPAGEIWMNAYTAGLAGVPFVFIAGDAAAAEEARQIAPDVTAAVVKWGINAQAVGLAVAPALVLAPQAARDAIRTATGQALRQIGQAQPFRPQPPFHLRASFLRPAFADLRAGRPGARLVDDLTVEVAATDEPWLLL